MYRKEFLLKIIKSGSMFLIPADWFITDTGSSAPVLFSFAIGSDLHYGQQGTSSEQYLNEFTSSVNAIHSKGPLSFCFVNGDLIHDDVVHLAAVKKGLGKLKMKYYVSQGNHDHCKEAEWKKTWNMPFNYTFTMHDYGFVAMTTSDEKGEYLCPDLKFLSDALGKFASKKGVFVFLHINTGKLKNGSIDCPDVLAVLKESKNLLGVFNGHDHDTDGVAEKDGVKFLFDGHLGGSWGLRYHGQRVVEINKDGSIQSYIVNGGVMQDKVELGRLLVGG